MSDSITNHVVAASDVQTKSETGPSIPTAYESPQAPSLAQVPKTIKEKSTPNRDDCTSLDVSFDMAAPSHVEMAEWSNDEESVSECDKEEWSEDDEALHSYFEEPFLNSYETYELEFDEVFFLFYGESELDESGGETPGEYDEDASKGE